MFGAGKPKRAGTVSSGDRVRIGGEKVTIRKVRRSGDTTNITYQGRKTKGQENFGNGEVIR